MQVASKKVYWKKLAFHKHLRHIAIEKDILSELNRCIFQISLKYIKLVIPEILFILILCSCNFYFRITCPPPPEIFTPPPQKLEGGGACPVSFSLLGPSLLNGVWKYTIGVWKWSANDNWLNPFSTNVSLTDKPGSRFLLAKCLKNACWRVTF